MLVPFLQPVLCQALYSLKGLHSKKVPCSRHYKVVKWCNLFRTQDVKTISCSVALLHPSIQAKQGSALSGLHAKYEFYAFKLAKSGGICYPRGYVESLIMYFLDGDKSKSLSALYFQSLLNFQHENLHCQVCCTRIFQSFTVILLVLVRRLCKMTRNHLFGGKGWQDIETPLVILQSGWSWLCTAVLNIFLRR